jgi:hypothetical protein
MYEIPDPIMPCPQCTIHGDPLVLHATAGGAARAHCNLCHGSGGIPSSVYLEYSGLNMPQIILYAIIYALIFLTFLIY